LDQFLRPAAVVVMVIHQAQMRLAEALVQVETWHLVTRQVLEAKALLVREIGEEPPELETERRLALAAAVRVRLDWIPFLFLALLAMAVLALPLQFLELLSHMLAAAAGAELAELQALEELVVVALVKLGLAELLVALEVEIQAAVAVPVHLVLA
jgi:hypothetical protein